MWVTTPWELTWHSGRTATGGGGGARTMSNLSTWGGGGGAGPLPHIHGVPGVGYPRKYEGTGMRYGGEGYDSCLLAQRASECALARRARLVCLAWELGHRHRMQS